MWNFSEAEGTRCVKCLFLRWNTICLLLFKKGTKKKTPCILLENWRLNMMLLSQISSLLLSWSSIILNSFEISIPSTGTMSFSNRRRWLTFFPELLARDLHLAKENHGKEKGPSLTTSSILISLRARRLKSVKYALMFWRRWKTKVKRISWKTQWPTILQI